MRHTKSALKGVAAVALFAAAASVAAWSGPPGTPPGCTSGYVGCDAPLNVSSTAQTKQGQLTVSSSASPSLNVTNSAGGYGAYGHSVANGGIGVRGDGASNNYGGLFQGGYGVQGSGAAGYGVYGTSASNIAVYGYTQGSSYGGYFYAPASGGVGVRGDGNAYGGYFYSTGSGAWAILGYGSYGLYTGSNVYANDVYDAAAGVWVSNLRLSQQLGPQYTIHYGGDGGICPSGSLMVGTTGWWSSFTDVYVYCRNILY
jgi:hypothetical protein